MSGKIRLIASDLDGTLLLNGAQSAARHLPVDPQPESEGDRFPCCQREAVSESAAAVRSDQERDRLSV